MIIYNNTKIIYKVKLLVALSFKEFYKMASFFLSISSGFHGKKCFFLSGLICEVQPCITFILIAQI